MFIETKGEIEVNGKPIASNFRANVEGGKARIKCTYFHHSKESDMDITISKTNFKVGNFGLVMSISGFEHNTGKEFDIEVTRKICGKRPWKLHSVIGSKEQNVCSEKLMDLLNDFIG